ncbi:c-type cytochrome [Modicisalibacter xianhensis]|uniref:Cytochrome c n=1 Tax=Modicisalibacter xianhensis TaxID=442341 RepID=A0A1I2Z396_9GAMM|nr:c-type cytochrome [Halomonas xianhensis]SFH32075.1 Cytochrome c [Halomonas xianhensis]
MRKLPKSFRLAMGIMLANVTLSASAQDPQTERDYQVPLPPAPSGDAVFQPPLESAIPDNQYGDMVRKGRDLFVDTQQLRGTHVFNEQNCSNCHLDAGRMANSAPMWAAFGMYPAYRGKNDKVNTLAERIQGCFTYSMNGIPPETGSESLVALETYFHWLATGAPVNQAMPGRGYAKLETPQGGYDPERGAQVYAEQCAVCHGSDGAGQKVGDRQVFPPLWGDGAYNWGAGMHRVNTAAAFIKANMPLGKPYSLSDEDAWDVAAFINSHERPQDPRRRGMESLEATDRTFHQHSGYYGDDVGGQRLGDHDNYGANPGSGD